MLRNCLPPYHPVCTRVHTQRTGRHNLIKNRNSTYPYLELFLEKEICTHITSTAATSCKCSHVFAHSHPRLHRHPSASLVLGSFTSIFSFVFLTLGQRGLKLHYYPYGTDKETEVQNGALTNPKPHGERVRQKWHSNTRHPIQGSFPHPTLDLSFSNS